MKLATWNVNSLKVRLPHVLDWLASEQPDVLCLQELKLEDKNFPRAELEAAGYHAAFSGQKTYNGVAILSREVPADVLFGIPGFDDEQKRVISGTVSSVRVGCGYFPNPQPDDSKKNPNNTAWQRALTSWLASEMAQHPKLALLGDYNIAPEDRDAHVDWKEEIHVSPAEREAFQAILALGLKDAFRLFEQPEKSFSWWDYRMMAFRRNFGLRIDHILLSPPLLENCRSCRIDKTPRALERPSDHAPVIVELNQ